MQIKSNAKKEQLSVNDNNKINLEAERKKVKLYINAAGVNTNELTLGTTISDFAKICNTNDKDNNKVINNKHKNPTR